ncbi:MAG TPA: methylenetetrahydrofolate reductase [Nitrospirota bacterium]|nr:methylenetetrahydrofolate reductase [Nitrospirota bacterium]
MKTFKDALLSGEFTITAECGPPKGTDIAEMLGHAKHLLGRVHALNVTDNQSAVVRIGSLPVSRLLLEMGHDPIYQLTCRDRNRLAIQSDLMGAHILGIRNVLCMTGDHVSAGDHKTAKAVYDLESVQLLQTVATLNAGKDLAGNEMKGATNLFQGAVVTPESNPLEPQMLKFEKKVKAGANFFQTQAIYDMDNFRRFMDRARKHDVKILAGILLLKNAGMANFLNKFVPGITVPEALIERLKAAGKEGALNCGMDIAAEQVRMIKEQGLADGVHVMAIGLENKVPDILQRAGIA